MLKTCKPEKMKNWKKKMEKDIFFKEWGTVSKTYIKNKTWSKNKPKLKKKWENR